MTNDNQTVLHSSGDADATVMGQRKASYQVPKKKGFNKWLLLLLIPLIFVLFIILGVAGFFVMKYYVFDEDLKGPEQELVQNDLSVDEAINKLSGLNLSLTDIQDVERNVIHTGTRDEEERLSRRLIALKHLYTNEFLRENHTVQNLRNIYMLYSTDFSLEQQNTLKWFFNLPPYQQDQWEYVLGNVNDFKDFRQKVEEELSRR